jgi:hypothetical protein
MAQHPSGLKNYIDQHRPTQWQQKAKNISCRCLMIMCKEIDFKRMIESKINQMGMNPKSIFLHPHEKNN